MGTIFHHAIVVTSDLDRVIDDAFAKAVEIGLNVLPPGEAVINGYRTLLVGPDGSKEGWEDSKRGDEQRKAYIEYLRRSACEWVSVVYGTEVMTPRVEEYLGDDDDD